MSLRKWRRRWGGVAVTGGLLAVAGGLAVVALAPWGGFRADPAAPAPASEMLLQAVPVAAPGAMAETQPAPEPSAKIQDSLPSASEPEPAFEDVELDAPYIIRDGHDFTSGRWVITLKGVTAPPRDAVCLDREGLMFACGLQARAALNNLLNKGKVTCNVRRPAIYGRFEATCRVADGDLAELLVARGWLRPAEGAAESLPAIMDKARKARAGLWNGGWRIKASERL